MWLYLRQRAILVLGKLYMTKSSLTKVQRRNATPSWSGYLHQGKVGILVAIKSIETSYTTDNATFRENIKHLRLAYEYHEDFVILNDDKIISTHQVKAKVAAGSDKKSAYGSALRDFDISTSPIDQRFLHVAVEIKDWDTSATPNIHNVQLYEYANARRYSSLTDNCVKSEAISYMQKIQPLRPTEELELIYYEILALLLDKVKECHALNNHSHPIITFEEIVNCIENPIIDSVKFVCDINRLKSLMVHILNQVEQDFEIINDDKGVAWDQATEVVEQLCKLDGIEFLKTLALLHPDDPDFINSKNLKSDGFKNVFIEIIRNAPSYKIKDNGYTKGGENYFLSNISEVAKFATPTAMRILSNTNNTKLLFEGKNIVTKELDGSFVSLVGADNSEPSDQNIIKPEMLKFVTVENTLAHLNERS